MIITARGQDCLDGFSRILKYGSLVSVESPKGSKFPYGFRLKMLEYDSSEMFP